MIDRLRETIKALDSAMSHGALASLEYNQVLSLRNRLQDRLAMEQADQSACHAEEANPDYD